jgi:Zn-dependent protease/predicted transcriptional regulator
VGKRADFMTMGQSWQIGRIFGIPLKVHVSWFLVFAWFTYGLAEKYFPLVLTRPRWEYWLLGTVAAFLLFASVLVHELGHSWVALRYRIPIAQITLFIFGGMAQIRREAPTPRAEFLIAIAGPVVSILISLFFGVMAAMSRLPSDVVAVATLLQEVNLTLAVFNLVPGYPLDGGRVLRAGLWAWTGNFHSATRYASRAGQGVAILLMLFGLYLSLESPVNGVWMLLIGAFLYLSAHNSHRQVAFQEALAGLQLSDIMTKKVVAIDANQTVEEAVNQYFSRFGYGSFPVVEDGRLIGLVTLKELTAVPREKWDKIRVGQVMVARDPQLAIPRHESVAIAMDRLMQEGRSRLIVTDGDTVVGILTRGGLGRMLDQLR